MNKEWFILIDGYHKGPYSQDELKELYYVEKLSPKTMIWAENMANWISISDLIEDDRMMEENDASHVSLMNEVYDLEDPVKSGERKILPGSAPRPIETKEDNQARKKKVVLPTAPAVKTVIKSKTEESEDKKVVTKKNLKPSDLVKKEIEEQIKSQKKEATQVQPPPIPLDALLNLDNVGNGKERKSNLLLYKTIAVSALALAFIGVIFWYVAGSSKPNVRIKGVMPVYVDRLQEIAQSNSSSAVFGIALSLDGKSITATTNKSGIIDTKIMLTSIDKRVLGSSKVVLEFTGQIKDHVGVFDKLLFIQGNQFYPGEYEVIVKGIKAHSLTEKIPFIKSIFSDLTEQVEYQSTAILYQGTPREFETKIIEYNNAQKEKLLAPFNQRAEQLKTFYSLLNKTTELYLERLHKISRPSEIANFETDFMKEVSPIIQALMIEALDENKKLQEVNDSKRDVSLIEFNSSLVLIGKDIGEMASDMITVTQELKSLTEKQKMSLREQFENRYKGIKNRIVNAISKVEEELKEINK